MKRLFWKGTEEECLQLAKQAFKPLVMEQDKETGEWSLWQLVEDKDARGTLSDGD